MVAVVAPLLQTNVIVPVPPLPEAVRLPSLPPLHVALLFTVIEAITDVAGSIIVTSSVPSHPLLSVAVTVYVPAVKLEIVSVVAPVVHAIVYGVAPQLVFRQPLDHRCLRCS